MAILICGIILLTIMCVTSAVEHFIGSKEDGNDANV
jgi:hypothetical protein